MSSTKKPTRTKTAASTDFPRKDVQIEVAKDADQVTLARKFAQIYTSPELAAHRVLNATDTKVGLGEAVDVPTLIDQLREQAKGSYDTLDAFRKQILDQIPAYQAMALVNEDYVGALDKMDAAYARIAEARRAANEADIEALANMERLEAQARSMATSIDTIGEAWYRATGQVAGFTVEVRTATKAVEETNPGFDAMIEELAKVSDEYGRMVPWIGALIAQLEKGTISVEDFLVQLDAMNRGFLQIQGMSGNMFGDIGSEVARLTKIVNDFVGDERKRTRDSTTRDWRKKS